MRRFRSLLFSVESLGGGSCAGCEKLSSEAAAAEAEKLSSQGKVMIIAGWSTFGIAYLAVVVTGYSILATNVIDSCAHDDPEFLCEIDTFPQALLIPFPFVGPLIGGGIMLDLWAETGGEKAFASLLIVDSVVQIVGFTVAVIGHVKYKRGKKKIKGAGVFLPGYSNDRFGITVAPFATGTGGGLGVTGYF